MSLRSACEPFVRIIKDSSGRIPYERLSAADWHALCRAYDETVGRRALERDALAELVRLNDTCAAAMVADYPAYLKKAAAAWDAARTALSSTEAKCPAGLRDSTTDQRRFSDTGETDGRESKDAG